MRERASEDGLGSPAGAGMLYAIIVLESSDSADPIAARLISMRRSYIECSLDIELERDASLIGSLFARIEGGERVVRLVEVHVDDDPIATYDGGMTVESASVSPGGESGRARLHLKLALNARRYLRS